MAGSSGTCPRCGATYRDGVVHMPGEVIPPGGDGQAAREAQTPAADPFRKALAVAILADALQLLLFPLFAPGALSPANDILDFVVCWLLVRYVGWHWAFVPSLIAELVPGLDELPSWTLAVLYVRAERRLRRSPLP